MTQPTPDLRAPTQQVATDKAASRLGVIQRMLDDIRSSVELGTPRELHAAECQLQYLIGEAARALVDVHQAYESAQALADPAD